MAGRAVISLSTGHALDRVTAGVAYAGCPPLPDLLARYDNGATTFSY